MLFVGDIVAIKEFKNPRLRYQVVRTEHYHNGNHIYALIRADAYSVSTAVMSPYIEDELELLERHHSSIKRLVKEFNYEDIVITSINHVRITGKIIAIKKSLWNSRVQYKLDTSNQWFCVSQLKDCKGGV